MNKEQDRHSPSAPQPSSWAPDTAPSHSPSLPPLQMCHWVLLFNFCPYQWPWMMCAGAAGYVACITMLLITCSHTQLLSPSALNAEFSGSNSESVCFPVDDLDTSFNIIWRQFSTHDRGARNKWTLKSFSTLTSCGFMAIDCELFLKNSALLGNLRQTQ